MAVSPDEQQESASACYSIKQKQSQRSKKVFLVADSRQKRIRPFSSCSSKPQHKVPNLLFKNCKQFDQLGHASILFLCMPLFLRQWKTVFVGLFYSFIFDLLVVYCMTALSVYVLNIYISMISELMIIVPIRIE